MQTHIKIAESIKELFPEGSNRIREMRVGGKDICVVWSKGTVRACAAKCPHAGARMAEGYVDGLGNVVCPLHRYRFELDRGRNVSGEGYHLKLYRVEEREDGLFVQI